MTDFAAVEQNLLTALALVRRPIAIAFREAPPAGVARLAGRQPSGCSFWRLAAAGHVFYTVPSDHYNCPIGSYTLNIPLPKEREPELTKITKATNTLSGFVQAPTRVRGIRMRSTSGA